MEAGAGVRATAFYEAVLDFDDRPDLDRPNGVWDVGSAEAAEMAKPAETTYRDVNIGLANQFAPFSASRGIDVFKVVEAANSQAYSHVHTAEPPPAAIASRSAHASTVDRSGGDGGPRRTRSQPDHA